MQKERRVTICDTCDFGINVPTRLDHARAQICCVYSFAVSVI